MGERTVPSGEHRRDAAAVAVIWLLVTAVLEWLAVSISLHPIGASDEAEIIDGAFDLLLVLGIPVFALVLVVLAYAVVRFRSGDGSDGPPVHSQRWVVWPWFAVTSALAVFVTIDPGFVGMAELRADDADPDIVVDITASQWSWNFDYGELGVRLDKADEFVLPEDQRVLLRVTSTDVIHSLWVPAFRIKADAVPGRVHEIYVTPTRLGGYDEDPIYRVQCAELCGTGHGRMRARVDVVTGPEFDEWVAANRTPPEGEGGGG